MTEPTTDAFRSSASLSITSVGSLLFRMKKETIGGDSEVAEWRFKRVKNVGRGGASVSCQREKVRAWPGQRNLLQRSSAGDIQVSSSQTLPHARVTGRETSEPDLAVKR